jgi:probable rRNA maturation factor
MAISFLNYECTLHIKNKTALKKWLAAVAKDEKRAIDELTYVFTTDDYLFNLNKKYLHHNTLTDIITFDYSKDGRLAGEVFISVDRVKENAKQFKFSFDDELHRVMVHGVLHLAGYTDKTPKKKLEMTRKENAALKKLN